MFGSKADTGTTPANYDEVRGFKSLPPKEQILVHALYAAFSQALRENAPRS